MPDLSPVILIEDDEDDFQLILSAYQATGCKRPVVWFDKPIEALTFLIESEETPFMIIADINMPMMNGFDLRRLMRETKVRTLMAVPFFFLTTSKEADLMKNGYELMVQGFFVKPVEFKQLIGIVDFMVQYATQASEAYAFA